MIAAHIAVPPDPLAEPGASDVPSPRVTKEPHVFPGGETTLYRRLLVARVPRVAAAHKRAFACQLTETREKLTIGLRTNTFNVAFAVNPAAMHTWHASFKHTQLQRDDCLFQRIERKFQVRHLFLSARASRRFPLTQKLCRAHTAQGKSQQRHSRYTWGSACDLPDGGDRRSASSWMRRRRRRL
jgi:hypothetical protein